MNKILDFCFYLIFLLCSRLFPSLKKGNIIFLCIIINTLLYSLLLTFVFFIGNNSSFPKNKDEVNFLKAIVNFGTIIIYVLLNLKYSINNRWEKVIANFINLNRLDLKRMTFLLCLFFITVDSLLILIYISYQNA